MKISLIQPSRNNLKYLKWSYDSIRKNQGEHEVQICVADDFSDDGTWQWCEEMMQKDPLFKAIRNDGPTRIGHTILYDKLINEVATFDICMIWHADMYLCPGALDAIAKYIGPKVIVSLTRIEPPLHPAGPEKILLDCGTEPETFDEPKLLAALKDPDISSKIVTTGIFAPWAFMKADFQEIGGHDPLFAPQSKEDSDIFNRFKLNGVSFVQTWQGFVYHMTCRGSRFNPTLTNVGSNSLEWEEQNARSTRNFIRKWGHFVKHDQFMDPIIPPLYDIHAILDNADFNALIALEPWFACVYVSDQDVIDNYIATEQPRTKYDLTQRVKLLTNDFSMDNIGVLVELDCTKLNMNSFNLLQQFPYILSDSGEMGEFMLGDYRFTITDLRTREKELIHT